MKTIVEYLINNHVNNAITSEPINYTDLKTNDYFVVDMHALQSYDPSKIVCKFKNGFRTDNTGVHHFNALIAVGMGTNGLSSIVINAECGFEPSKDKFRTPDKDELELLQIIDNELKHNYDTLGRQLVGHYNYKTKTINLKDTYTK